MPQRISLHTSRLALLVSFLTLGCCAAVRGAGPVRAALLDFQVDDSYYRSLLAAQNYTAAVQAHLAAEPTVQWVERSQLQTAMEEMNLTILNLPGGASALRLGKWVKADLLVLGEFLRQGPKERTLHLQVIGSDRAEVLAQDSLVISGDTRDPVPQRLSDVDATVPRIRQLLTEARRVRDRSKQQIILAPLFFRNLSDTPRLDYLERDIAHALVNLGSRSPKVRVLNFFHGHQPVEESELVLLGLADADPRAWQHVADVYVWGSYQEERNSTLPFDQVPVTISISFSRGGHVAQDVVKRVRVGQLAASIQEIALEILAQVERPATADHEVGSPGKVARVLVERVTQMERTLGQYGSDNAEFWRSDFGKAARRNLIESAELARFFDPLNADLSQRLLTLRWLKPNRKSDQSRSFMSRWQMAQAYERHLQTFGSVDSEKRTPVPAAGVYLDTLQGLLEQLRGQEHYEQFPVDMPADMAGRLQRRFLDQYMATVLRLAKGAAPDPGKDLGRTFTPWLGAALPYIIEPAKKVEWIEALWPICRYQYLESHGFRASLPADARRRTFWTKDSLGEAILNAYEQAGRSERAKELLSFDQPTPTPTPRPALPSGFSSRGAMPFYPGWPQPPFPIAGHPGLLQGPGTAPARDLRDLWIAKVPNVYPSMRYVMFSKPASVAQRWGDEVHHGMVLHSKNAPLLYQMDRMVVAADRLWISGRIMTLPSQYDSTSSSPQVYGYDPAADALVNVTEKAGNPSCLNDLAAFDGKVWLAMTYDGVLALDPRTLSVRRFAGQDGVLTPNMAAAAVWGDRIFFGGSGGNGTPKLNFYDRLSRRWGEQAISPAGPTAASGGVSSISFSAGSLWAYRHWLLIGGGQRTLIDTKTGAAMDLRSFPGTQAPIPALPGTSPYFLPGQPLPLRPGRQPSLQIESPKTITADGTGFWLGSRGTLVHYDPESQATRQIPMEGADVIGLASDGEVLWVAVSIPFTQYGRQRPRAFQRGFGNAEMDHPVRYYVMGRHLREDKWIGKLEVSCRILGLAASPGRLWAAVERHDEPVLEIDKREFGTFAKGSPFFQNAECAEAPGKAEAAKDRANPFGRTLLMQAADSGSLDAVNRLIEAGADVNAATSEGWTALMAAARQGHLDVVRALVARGADINAAKGHIKANPEWGIFHDAKLTCPLLEAAQTGRTPVVAYLLDHGAEIDTRNNFGQTPIMVAAKYGRLETVRLLLARKANSNLADLGQDTALALAVQCGSLPVVDLLIDHGAQVNIRRGDYYDLLHFALDGGYNDILRRLLERGAEPAPNGPAGYSLLRKAVWLNNDEAFDILISHHVEKKLPPEDVLHVLAELIERRKTNLFYRLLAENPNLNQVTSPFSSPLAVAAGKGDVDAFKALLDHGVDINRKEGGSSVGAQALLRAVQRGSFDITQMLLDKGTNTEARAEEGAPPLMLAAARGRADLVCLLLTHRADVNAVDTRGRSVRDYAGSSAEIQAIVSAAGRTKPAASPVVSAPKPGRIENPLILDRELVLACRKGSALAVSGLLKRGANPDAKDDAGWPIVTLAAAQGYVEVVKALCEHKANVNAPGPGKWTALMQAAGHDHADTVRLLMQHDAKVYELNQWGKNALDIAGERNCVHVLRVFDQANVTASDGRALIRAVGMGDMAAVKMLVGAGMNINGVDRRGRSALGHLLHLGFVRRVDAGYLENIRWFLDHGADPIFKDGYGETPLTIAVCFNRQPAVVKLLLQYKVRMDVTDNRGRTLLMMAQDIRDPAAREKIVGLLSRAGAK